MSTRKMNTVLLLIAIGLFLSIAQTTIVNAANLTTDADKVESMVEITDIIEKEMQKPTDYTKFDIINTVVDNNFLWSPDGSRLLILAQKNMMTKGLDSIYDVRRVKCGEFGLHERASTLFWINADGSEVTNIARAEESIRAAKNNTAAFIQSAWWSPSGDKIVFLVLNPCDEKPNILYISDINGSILAEVKGLDYSPIVWSPDKNKINILDRNDKTRIYVIDVENSTVKQLSLGIHAIGYPDDMRWSPDREKIAFIGKKDGNVYTVNVGNSSVQRLTTNVQTLGLRWKPDGTKLVFVTQDGIYAMDSDGGNPTLIEKGNFKFWSWSPDGKKLLCIKGINEKGGFEALQIFEIGSGTTKLIDVKDINYITWSPNGDRIAFHSDFNRSIYTVNSDGTDKVTRVASSYKDWEGMYSWGLDNKIYSFTNDSLVKINPDGTERLQLINNIPINSNWWDNWGQISLSPDGSRVLFTFLITGRTPTYILKMKGYDEVMSIYSPSSIKQGDSTFIEAKSMSKPIENATIFLNGRELGKTNESGFLEYSFKEGGNLMLSAVKQGFRMANKSITVEESPSEQSSPEPTLTSTPQITKPATVTPKAPGFDVVPVIGILFTINLFKRRYN